MANHRAVLALASAAALALAGCTSSAPSSSASPPGFVMPEDIDISAYSDVHAALDSSVESIVFPIDAFFNDPAEQDRIGQANALLLDDCMKKGGRTYPLVEFDLTGESAYPNTPYGMWGLEHAAQVGYALDTSAQAQSTAANDAVAAEMSADAGWDPAFLACLDETEQLPGVGRDAGGDTSLAVAQLPQTIRNEATMLASKRPEWEETRRAWSDCLVEHGLTLRSNEMQPWAPEVPDDPESAIRTAVIDVQCKDDTDLVETLSSLESQYQAAMIDQQRAALDEVAEAEAAIVARADDIIATHGS